MLLSYSRRELVFNSSLPTCRAASVIAVQAVTYQTLPL